MSSGILSANQMIVIDTNGNIRTATIGEKLPHGTVIVQRGDNITDDAELKAQLVDANNTPQDITDDVARIFAALEEGQDPTQIDDAEAPAAGGAQGSALAEAATIERIGSETIATTDFDTTGFESLGLSQTQSLALSSLLVVSTGSLAATEDTTATITITGTNDAPTVAGVSATKTEDDASFTLDLLANSHDEDASDVLKAENITLTGGDASGVSESNGVFTVDPSAYNALASGETETITYSYDVVEYDDEGNVLSTTPTTATITITGTNDAPTVAGVSATKTEDDASFTLDLLANSHDEDASDVLKAENITLTGGDASGVSESNGVFTVDPSAYNALASGETETITYSYDVVEYDDEGNVLSTTPTTATITITGTNDAPTVAGVSATKTEDDASFTLDLLANSHDEDASDVLKAENITLTGGDASGVSESNGVFTVDPSAYNALASGETETITYSYDVVEYDDEGNVLSTTPTTATITITGTNDAPTVAGVSATKTEDDASFTLDLLANSHDEDASDVLKAENITLTGGDASGVSESNGVFTVDPSAYNALASGETETITYSYDVVEYDDEGNVLSTTPTTATITITGTNDAPTVAGVSATKTEDDASFTLDLLANSHDEDASDVLKAENITLTGGDASGVSESNGVFTVDPSAYNALASGETETITYSYDVVEYDDEGNVLSTTPTTATITITGTNDAPTVAGVSATKTEDDASFTLDLLANSHDEDASDVLKAENITLTGGDASGVSESNGVFTVDPSAYNALASGETETITYSYDVVEYDDEGNVLSTTPTTATITITGTNDAPTVAGVSATKTEDDASFTLDLLANSHDEDASDVLKAENITLTGGDASGVSESNGVFTVDPSAYNALASGETETITYSYDVVEYDDEGNVLSTTPTTATITITGTNDAPTVAGVSATKTEDDASFTLDLLANSHDEDASDVLKAENITLTGGDASGVSESNGVFTVDPSAYNALASGETETITYSYDVVEYDDEGNVLSTTPTTATITITGTNDAPTVAGVSATKTEDDASFTLDLLANSHDEDASDVLKAENITLTGGDASGVSESNGVFTVDPSAYNALASGETETITYSYDVVEYDDEGNVLSTTPTTATITITGTNDAPTVAGVSATKTEDDASFTLDLLANSHDEDASDVLKAENITLTGGDASGVSESNGVFTVDPSAYNALASGETETITYSYDVVEYDDEGNVLSTTPTTATITITGTNDAPTVAGVSATKTEDDASFTLDLLANSHDEDASDVLKAENITLTGGDASGVSESNGVFTVDPSAYNALASGETETITYSYDVVEYDDEGNVLSTTPTTATITITGTNDAPTVAGVSATKTEDDASFTLDLLANSHDEDASDVLKAENITLTGGDASGVSESNGVFTVDPSAYNALASGETETITYSYDVVEYDDEGNVLSTTPTTATITITGTNDAPTVAGVSATKTEDDASFTLDLLANSHDEDASDVLKAENITLTGGDASGVSESNGVFTVDPSAYNALASGETETITYSYDVVEYDDEGNVLSTTPTTATITITGTNDAPTVAGVSATKTEDDASFTLDLLANSHDEDASDVLKAENITLTGGDASGVSESNGVFTVDPSAYNALASGETETITYSYDVVEYDDEGNVLSTTPTTATITITGTNDAPTVAGVSATKTEDDASFTLDLLANSHDEDASDVLKAENITLTGGDASGVSESNGVFTVDPSAYNALASGETETITYSYDVVEYDDEGNVLSTTPTTATITITGTNDAPTVAGVSATKTEDDASFTLDLLANSHDEDASDVLKAENITLTGGDASGVSESNGVFTVDPSAYNALASGETETITYSYDVVEYDDEGNVLSTTPTTATITITGTNDAPTVAGVSATKTEDDASFTLDLLANSHDEDASDVLKAENITLTGGDASGVSESNGVFTVDPSAYNALASGETETITYSYDVVEYDDEGNVLSTTPTTATITITGTNDAPTVAGVSATKTEDDASFTLDLLANSHDEDASDVLKAENITLTGGDASGVSESNGVFTVDPSAYNALASGETETITYSYDVVEYDDEGNVLSTTPTTATITITGTNDAPTVAGVSATKTEDDASFTLDLLANSHDEDASDVLKAENITLTGGDASGVSESNGVFTVDPSAYNALASGETETITYSYDVVEYDDEGNVLSTTPTTATITITGTNDAPTVAGVSATKTEDDASFTLDLLANSHDEDASDVLKAENITLTGGDASGVSESNGVFTVDPSAYNALASGETETITYSYDVVEYDDEGNVLSTTPTTATITITGTNDAPTVAGVSATKTEDDASFTLDLLANSHDEDASDVLKAENITLTGGDASGVSESNGVFTVDPSAYNALASGETETITYSYDVVEYDDEGNVLSTTPTTATITITGTNDAPTVAGVSATKTEDDASFTLDLLANSHDEDASDVLKAENITLTGGDASGVSESNGVFTVDPSAYNALASGETETITYSYDVVEYDDEGNVLSTTPTTATITITGTNDAPTVAGVSATKTEDDASFTLDLLANSHDEDASDVLKAENITLTGGDASGVSESNGVFTVDPSAYNALASGETETITYSYDVVEYDDEGNVLSTTPTTATITITGTNDAPTVAGVSATKTEDDASFTLDLLANSHDEDASDVLKAENITLTGGDASGVSESNGVFTVDPSAYNALASGETETITYSYDVVEYDDEGNVLSTTPTTATITITGTNDAPTVAGVSATKTEDDASFTLDLLANSHDEDASDVLKAENITLTGGDASGVSESNGVFTVDPSAYNALASGETETITYSYDVVEYDDEGNVLSTTPTTATITITGTNDAPTVAGVSATKTEDDASFTLDLLANSHDEDASDVLKAENITLTGGDASGVSESNGVFTVDPSAYNALASGETETITYSYDVVEYDDEGNVLSTTPTTATITITGTNDAPTVAGVSATKTEDDASFTLDLLANSHDEDASDVLKAENITLTGGDASGVSESNGVFTVDPSAYNALASGETETITYSYDVVEYDDEGNVLSTTPTTATITITGTNDAPTVAGVSATKTEDDASFTLDLLANSHDEDASDVLKAENITLTGGDASGVSESNGVFTVDPSAYNALASGETETITYSYDVVEYDDEGNVLSTTPTTATITITGTNDAPTVAGVSATKTEDDASFTLDLLANSHDEDASDVLKAENITLTGGDASGVSESNGVFTVDPSAYNALASGETETITYSYDVVEYDDEGNVLSTTPTTATITITGTNDAPTVAGVSATKTEDDASFTLDLLANSHDEDASDVLKAENITLTGGDASGVSESNGVFTVDPSAYNALASGETETITYSYDVVEYDDEGNVLSTTPTTATITITGTNDAPTVAGVSATKTEDDASFTLDLLANSHDEDASDVLKAENITLTGGDASGVSESNGVFTVDPSAYNALASGETETITYSYDVVEYDDEGNVLSTTPTTATITITGTNDAPTVAGVSATKTEDDASFTLDLLANSHDEDASDVLKAENITLTGGDASGVSESNGVFTVDPSAYNALASGETETITYSYDVVEYDDEGNVLSTTPTTATITITGTNDAPTVAGVSATKTEDDASFTLDLLANSHDEDASDVLKAENITLTGGDASGVSESNGVFTVDPSAYNALASGETETITYSYDVVEYDDEGNVLSTTPTTATITITGTNDAPTVAGVSATKTEDDASFTLDLLANSHDEDASDVLKAENITLTGGDASGVSESNGVFTVDPSAYNALASGETETITYSYDVVEYDDEGNVLSTTPTTATITITGTNDAPTVAGVSATKTEDDASFTLDLLANSHDEDASDVLKAENITLTGGDASGVSESNGVFTVDPSAYNALASGETETITYSYDVVEYDDEGNVLSTTPTTATITITGTNDAPTVAGVSATKTEDDASFTLDLLANSHDEDASDVLKAENITLTGGDASGVSESNGVFTVDPSAYNALASGETETITYSYDVVEYDDEGNVLSTTPTTATITITGTNDAPTVAGVSATKTEDDASFTLDLLANSHDEDASDVLKAENITLTGGDASGVSESNGVFTVDPSAYNALASGETETITYSYDVVEYDDEGNVLSTTPTTATITITGTNDAPTVAGVSATKTEDDASFTLDLLANSHDEDASDVLKAENITLTGGDASGVSESNGVFTVDPSAYNALASGETETITYSYDVVEYDDEGNVLSTTPTTATITITGTNDAPTVAGVSATKTEDDASFTLDLLANSHDEDASDVLKAENITLTGGDASGVSESNGVFTVDPSAYNALASGETETITYSYDVVEYDDEGNVLSTTPTTATITITGTNDAPTVAGVSATKTEDDASFTLDLLANSHDEDASDVLKAENITLTGGDASGVSESNGVFTVDPSAYNALASGETETITYSYDVVEYDDEGNVLSTTPTTATITITGTNDAPTVAGVSATKTEDDASFTLDLLANSHDEDASDVLKAENITLTGGDASGVSESNGVFTVDPSAYNALASGETETITYSYDVVEYDDEGNVLSTTPTTATITITGTNDAPTVAGVSATKTEDDASFTLDLLANSHDEDASDVLKAENITLTGGDASGVSESNGVFTVDPSAYNALASGETETITYSYDVVEYDDEGNVLSTTPTTATITITGTNDAPTVAGVSATKTEDDASFTLDLLANSHDEDASDVLKAENITLTGGDASGVSESNGVFTVDPSAYNALASGETETITYSYDVVEYDDEGNVLSTTPTTATITITGTNDAPTVAGVSATKTEDDASFTLDLLANSHDEDASDVLKAENITLTGGDASGVSESNGVFTVDPSAYNALASGETETITYSYDVVEYDDEGNVLSTTPTTATITITGTNDAPTVAGVSATKTEDDASFTLDLLANSHDEDASDVLKAENITLTGGDASGVSESNGVFTVDPSAYNALASGETETITYSYDVVEYDDEGNVLSTTPTTATITITGTNDAPTVAGVSATKTEDDASFTLDLLANSHDEDASDVLKAENITLTGGDASGVSESNGVFTVDPSAYNALASGETETITYSYDVVEYDDEGNVLSTTPTTATITITGTNDAPTVAGVSATKTEDDASFTLDLLANSHDEDASDVLKAENITLTGGDASGVSESNGVFTVDPSAYNALASGETETITYSYDVVEYDDEGNVLSTTPTTATITITGTNDAPTVAGVSATKTEDDASFTLDLLANSHDEDASDVLKAENITLTGGDASGVSESNGVFTVDPSAYNALASGETETITYSYDVVEYDDEGNVLSTTPTTATITITGTNDAPTVAGVSATKTEDDASFTLDLLANSHDEDASDVLKAENITLTGGDASGVSESNGVFTVDPSAYNALASGETETITYSYDVVEYDDEGNVLSTTPTTATITITGTNDAPTVAGVSATKTEDDASFTLDLLANSHDEDASDVLKAENITLTGGDASGVSESNGVFTVDPSAYNALASGETETITYSYDVVEYDDEGNVLSTTPTTATITITGTNDAPTVAGVSATKTEDDASFTLDLLANSHDEDASDVLKAENITLTGGDASGVSESNGVFTVDPSAYNALASGETETITYSYDVVEYDDEGNVLSTTPTTATITITGTNDAPTVAGVSATKTEDDASFTLDLLANSHDEDASDVLKAENITLTGGDASGVSESNGVFTVDPSAARTTPWRREKPRPSRTATTLWNTTTKAMCCRPRQPRRRSPSQARTTHQR
ncbi:hypothetical protein JTI97_14770 [Vibrio fluvialis]|uniref:cadherin-like domain-containing protein n=1 Tax=Vibrio fluvialis TaxID=676 RepID=UPI001ABDABFD|nr:hypothetical protein [Vibrio fluvialis]QTG94277.1 hypothetical protein JTI97_14770 [Vibrio fluvialis]